MRSTACLRIRRGVARALLLLPALILAATACAPAPSSPLRQPGEGTTNVSVQTIEGTSEHRISREDYVALSDLAAPRSDVWPYLLDVWKEVGLPDPVADPRAFTLTVREHTVMRRLGNTALSTYLSCGSSISGWNADTHRIRLTVRTLLERVSADTTRVHTRVDAVAFSTSGASAGPIQCTTRGGLEAAIAQRLRNRLDFQIRR